MESATESTLQSQRDDEVQGQEDSVSEVKTEKELEEIELKSYITSDLHIVPEIVSAIHSADRKVRLAATVKVRRLMRELMESARQPLVNSELIEPVVGMLSFDDLELCEEAAWILINFTAGSVSDSEQLGYEMTRHMIPVLIKFIKSTADETFESFAEVLRSLSRISVNKTAAEDIVATGITPRLVELCVPGNDNLRHCAVHCLGRFTSHCEPSIEAPIQAGFLTALRSCINCEHDDTRLDACWATWNIAKSSLTHAQALFDNDLVAPIFKMISNPEEGTRTRQNAVCLLFTLTKKAKEHNELFPKLVQANCMEAFAWGLASTHYHTLRGLLKGLKNVVYAQWSGREEALERFKLS
ncbi:hypothetical protein FRC00_003893, partial [Tulasnella sp. 408]